MQEYDMATLTEKMDNALGLLYAMDSKINVHLQSHVASDKLLAKLSDDIDGDGKDGLEKRVSKIEQALKWIAWTLGIIGAGVLGDLGTRIASAIFK